MNTKRTPVEERLARQTRITSDGCVVFTGYVPKNGYPQIGVGGRRKKRLVHRVAYELYIGSIPEGLEVDHVCGNRQCVNPDHLEAVTRAENMRRAVARKTHCKRGHEFTPENTYYWRGRPGRACRACARIRDFGRRSGWQRSRDAEKAAA